MSGYDFETLVRRENVGSGKWDEMSKEAIADPQVIPFSVADMELKNPPEIAEGLKNYMDSHIMGYTGPTEEYFDAVIGWMTRRHNFTPKKEWIIQTAGVVSALYDMVAKFTKPEDAVLIMEPVYYPFRMSIEKNRRQVVTTNLKVSGNTYDIDFEDMEAKMKRKEVTLMILCSPHNPVGRIWTKEEITHIAELCYENGVFLVSDEIHFDLILPGYKHYSTGCLEEKLLNNCAICTAPSKTFNLAGFQTSNIIIPNAEYRDNIEGARGYFSLNILGYEACRIAYNECEAWLDELLELLEQNKCLVETYLKRELPMLKPFELQGTYLMWIDCSALGMDDKVLENFMREKAQLYLDEGYIFGAGGSGFERVNLACPTQYLEAALHRLKAAVNL